jgi:PKD repeat protein
LRGCFSPSKATSHRPQRWRHADPVHLGVVQSGPSGVTFDSNNGTSAGSNVTAIFSQAGSYTFQVTVTDSLGATGTGTTTVIVQQALNSISVSPNTATVADQGQQHFTATALDQFGKALIPQPSFTWSVDSPAAGSISGSGLYTAPLSGHGTDTVQATVGSVSRTATVTYVQPPSITAVSATPNSVTGKTTQLTATATDPNGVGALIYTWSLVSGPAGVTFGSNNSTASGNNVTALFSKAGSYTFQITVTDSYRVSSTQTVSVTVQQSLSSVSVSPATASIRVKGTVQFTATALDQFGNPLAVQPSLTWILVSGPGTLSSNGRYTGTSTGTAVIQATVTGTTISETGTVTVRKH